MSFQRYEAPPLPTLPARGSASDLLRQAAVIIEARGATRDKPDGERSMAETVRLFNEATGHNLSEADGWEFMISLKKARGNDPDSLVDRLGYTALLVECLLRRQSVPPMPAATPED